MNKILEELTEGSAPEAFTDEQLGTLGIAANRLVNKQLEINEAEDNLKNLKAQERNISQNEIPQLMENLGFDKITLKDGRNIGIKEAVQCAIPSTEKPAAYAWMDKNGHGDLIKTALTAKFARGDQLLSHAAQDHLNTIGVASTLAESVHAGTLKAWAREELAQGHSLPADLFKIHVVKLTTVS